MDTQCTTQTHVSEQKLTSYNANVIAVILQECLAALEESPQGQELSAVRVALTEPIYKLLGQERGGDFENLIAQSITFYGEQMFEYGLQIGRNSSIALTLPDSGY